MGVICGKQQKGATKNPKKPLKLHCLQSEILQTKNEDYIDPSSREIVAETSIRRSPATQCLVKQSSTFGPQESNASMHAVITSTANIHKIYRIETKTIGHGHFGSVRLARSVKEPSKVFAVKTILKEKIINLSNMLMQELEILKTLDHPNIIKFYETYQDEECFHIVMEYCSGGDLIDRLGNHACTEDEARRIMRMAFSAVKHLHEKGIVHRDLKLENFLFADRSEDSEIKLIDFGLAKRVRTKGPMKLKSFVGTCYYVAPEVIKANYDEKCDEWSLGVMTYILLTGKPPFEGKSDSEIFENIQMGYVDYYTPLWTNFSSTAKDFVRKLLTFNTENRITAAQALEHPWITQNDYSTEITSSRKRLHQTHSEIVENIRTFENRHKFKKEVLRIMTTLLSDEETKKLREGFRFFDINNTGEVSVSELRQTMYELGYIYTEEEIKQIIRGITLCDEGECIKYTDFLVAAMDSRSMSLDKLQVMFKYFDIDDTKHITSANIKEMMVRAGRKMEDKEIEDMIKDVDVKGDGRIAFEEFCSMMNVGTLEKNDLGELILVRKSNSMDEIPDEKEQPITVLAWPRTNIKEF